MDEIDQLIQEFPPGVRRHLRDAWQRMPEATRAPLLKALRELPGDLGRWRELIRLALSHARVVTGDKRRVAIVGPANVGKSTLYNQLVRSTADRAEVSAVPGTTRVSQAADAGLFAVVDTPGADAVGAVGEAEKEQAFAAARAADFLVVVFDAIQGVKRDEQQLFRELQALEHPYVVVLNKVDLVEGASERDRVVEAAARNLGLAPEEVVPCVARDGKRVERVLLAVAKAEPEIVAALGAALPDYRMMLAWSATKKAAATAAAIALAPLPILDVFPLLAVQTSLVLGIARIYGQRITFGRARELVVTFGLGFLGRTLFQELSKLGGPPGWLLAAAIASSTTAVMGRAAAVWFERGVRVKASDCAPRAARSRRGCCSRSRRWAAAGPPAKPCRVGSRPRCRRRPQTRPHAPVDRVASDARESAGCVRRRVCRIHRSRPCPGPWPRQRGSRVQDATDTRVRCPELTAAARALSLQHLPPTG